MRRASSWVLWGALVLGQVGCAGNRVVDGILNYPVDRACDLADVVGFEFFWGQGFIAHAQATKFAQIGIGTFDGDILKYNRRAIGIVEEIRSEAGLPLYYFSVYDRRVLRGNTAFENLHRDLSGLGEVHYNLTDENDRGFYELGGSLGVFAGLGLSLDIFQVVDFMLGWVGVDVGRDDVRNRERRPVHNPRYKSVGEKPVSEGLNERA